MKEPMEHTGQWKGYLGSSGGVFLTGYGPGTYDLRMSRSTDIAQLVSVDC